MAELWRRGRRLHVCIEPITLVLQTRFNSEDPYERIDYIFVKTDEPLCSEMTVTDTEASDHCPVDAVLTY